MSRLFILLLLILGASVWIGTSMVGDPGYIRIFLAPYLVEMTIPTACVLIVVVYLLLMLVFRLLRGIWGSGGKVRSLVLQQQAQRAATATTRGVIHLTEGRWEKAERQLARGAKQSSSALVNYLGAAEAARNRGDLAAGKRLLAKADTSEKGAELAVGIMLAQMQLAGGEFADCIETLNRLDRKIPHHPMVLRLQSQVYLQEKDWESLARLLPRLRKSEILSENELKCIERDIWHARLQAALGDSETSVDVLETQWKLMPPRLHRDPETIRFYARALIDAGNEAEAEVLLRQALNIRWHDDLAELYGRVEGNEPALQLRMAETWKKHQGDNPVLLLTLGRICLRNQLWGKAREYLEASANILPYRQDALAELGRLVARLGHQDLAVDYFLRSLSAGNPLPDLPMPRPRVSAAFRPIELP